MSAALLREELLFIGRMFDRARVPNVDSSNGDRLSMAERATAAVAMLTGAGPDQLNAWVRATLVEVGRPEHPDPKIDAKVPRPRLIAVALAQTPGESPLLTITLGSEGDDAASVAILLGVVDAMRELAMDLKPVLPFVRAALEKIVAGDTQARMEAN